VNDFPRFLLRLAIFGLIAGLGFGATAVQIDPSGALPSWPAGPGVTVDEGFNVQEGVRLVIGLKAWFRGAVGWREVFGDRKNLGPNPPLGFHLADHPPAGRVWLGLWHQAGAAILEKPGQPERLVYAYARLGSAAAFALIIFLVGFFSAKWYGMPAGLIAAGSLVLMPRVFGHRAGSRSVRTIVEESCRLGFQQLTLYCLSSENWKRPARELRFLMRLLRHFLIVERRELMDQNVRLAMIGDRNGLPDDVLAELDRTITMTASNTGLTLCLAINYGARAEIVEAVRQIAQDVERGRLAPEQITEPLIADHLQTAGMPDPDLLIRTAGEQRLSNYLLWQISYAEFWVTDAPWPDFQADHLHQAVLDYARRQRKFGGLPRANGSHRSA